jgi:putative transcriptional regulator
MAPDSSCRQLGNRLRELRARHRLTQAQLAESVGVTRKTINTVENKIFIPSTLLALKIAQALDVDVGDVFYLEPQKELQ